MDARPKEIRIYEDEEGRAPFSEWMDRQEAPLYGRVMARLERVELGNLGDHRGVGDGVFELRIDFGPGYRVYFGGAADWRDEEDAATRYRNREAVLEKLQCLRERGSIVSGNWRS